MYRPTLSLLKNIYTQYLYQICITTTILNTGETSWSNLGEIYNVHRKKYHHV